MPLSPTEYDWLAARLAIAVYDINAEHRRMSIQSYRESLRHIPGAESLTMRYGAGDTQIFAIGDMEVEVAPMATFADVATAFLEAKKKA